MGKSLQAGRRKHGSMLDKNPVTLLLRHVLQAVLLLAWPCLTILQPALSC
jgi:hypothetical protein